MAKTKPQAPAAEPKASKKGPSANDAASLIALRNRFFYVFYRKQLALFVSALALCLVSASLAGYFIFRKVPPVYVAVGADKKLLPSAPLDQPTMDDAEMDATVTQWAWEATQKLYTYDYINFRTQIQEGSPYFTYNGWKNYLEALSSSNEVRSIEQFKLIGHVQPLGAPQIVRKEIVTVPADGSRRLSWQVDFPVVIKRTANVPGSGGFVERVNIRMKIYRISVADSPKGIGIDGFVAERPAANGK